MGNDLRGRVAAGQGDHATGSSPPGRGTVQFVKATRSAVKARVALTGPSGAGKTWTGLTLACALGEQVAVIDTERGRASMYAGLNGWEFDTLNPHSFSPGSLVEALGVASGAGYDAVLVDSLSHYWSGVDGMQEQADRRSQSGNSFSGWKAARPDERRMFDAIAAYPGHVIVTLRSKTSYVIEEVEQNGRKRNVPRKIGLKPDQREGIEFEFDLIGDMDQSNALTVSKSRLPGLTGEIIERPGPDLAKTIREWLSEGGESATNATEYRTQALADDITYEGLRALYDTVTAAGVLNAPMTDASGEPTVLGDLIRARGSALTPPKDPPAADAPVGDPTPQEEAKAT